MPDDRIFKFSSCGLMFLGASLYFFYLFGGEIPVLKQPNDFRLTEGFNIFLSLFFGTPIIGIIISTITVKMIFLFRGYKHYCYVPTDPEVIKGVIVRHQLQDIDENVDLRLRSNRKILVDFYPFYQVEVRRIIKEEALKFLDRRWSTTNTHINNISAIGFALLFMLSARWEYFELCNLFFVPGFMVLLFLVMIAYVWFGFYHIIQSRWEGAHVEHICLRDFYRQERQQNLANQTTQTNRLVNFEFNINKLF